MGERTANSNRLSYLRGDLRLDLLVVVLVGIICWPLHAAGYLLAKDAQAVPQVAWDWEILGLSDVPPRAVPLDAFVALLTSIADGGMWHRMLLPATLLAIGCGAHRGLPQLGVYARATAATWAVWNVFLMERLALGQWALLVSLATLWWLPRFASRSDGRGLALAAGVIGLGSLTPSGGLIVCAVVGCGVLWSAYRPLLLGFAALAQAPWVVAGLAGGGLNPSDPTATVAFAPQGEAPGGVIVSLLSLGGIWDDNSVPATHTSGWAVASAAVCVGLVWLAWPSLWRQASWRPVVVCSGLAFGFVWVVSTALGGQLLGQFIEVFPAAGLLRDGQKFLLPAACVVPICAGLVTQRLADSARDWIKPTLWATAVVPLVLLPDATRLVWPVLQPVQYPIGLSEVASRIEGEGRVIALPWRSYRQFSWGNPQPAADPLPRWLRQPVLVDDDLLVGSATIAGESPERAELDELLASGPPIRKLSERGIRWVVVYRDDPEAEELDLSGLTAVYQDEVIALYSLAEAGFVATPPPSSRVAALLAHVVWALLLGAGMFGVLWSGVLRWRARSHRP